MKVIIVVSRAVFHTRIEILFYYYSCNLETRILTSLFFKLTTYRYMKYVVINSDRSIFSSLHRNTFSRAPGFLRRDKLKVSRGHRVKHADFRSNNSTNCFQSNNQTADHKITHRWVNHPRCMELKGGEAAERPIPGAQGMVTSHAHIYNTHCWLYTNPSNQRHCQVWRG